MSNQEDTGAQQEPSAPAVLTRVEECEQELWAHQKLAIVERNRGKAAATALKRINLKYDATREALLSELTPRVRALVIAEGQKADADAIVSE